MFRRMFGGDRGPGQGAPVSASSANKTVEAIQKLGETEELLIKRRNLIEKKIDQETERAKDFTKANNKRAALQCLKKRKLYESQLESVENNIMRVNEQQMMLENQRTTVETVSALSNAAKASKQTMHEMKVDDVDQVLDNINEQNEAMEQINAAMGQPIGPSADIDEDDLEKEFMDMQAEQLDEELLEPAAVPSTRIRQQEQPMPSVPAGRAKVAPKLTPEEEELEALQAEMAL